MTTLKLGNKFVGAEHPTYFIADISANHDGDLERAKLLIRLCAEAGADAAKFQNFRAAGIISERGFRTMGAQLSHQAKWKKSVCQVYREASLPWGSKVSVTEPSGAMLLFWKTGPLAVTA